MSVTLNTYKKWLTFYVLSVSPNILLLISSWKETSVYFFKYKLV